MALPANRQGSFKEDTSITTSGPRHREQWYAFHRRDPVIALNTQHKKGAAQQPLLSTSVARHCSQWVLRLSIYGERPINL
jgi:hypothetical protein